MAQKHTPIVNAPASGEVNRVFGFKRYFRITPEDTGGAFCVFEEEVEEGTGPPLHIHHTCLLYTSPSPRDGLLSRMPSSA